MHGRGTMHGAARSGGGRVRGLEMDASRAAKAGAPWGVKANASGVWMCGLERDVRGGFGAPAAMAAWRLGGGPCLMHGRGTFGKDGWGRGDRLRAVIPRRPFARNGVGQHMRDLA